VAIADKLDSVVGCFAVGVVPSVPAIRLRCAGGTGIVKIVLEKKLPISLALSVSYALKLCSCTAKEGRDPEQEAQILDFLRDRARYVFREKDGFNYDEVNAVFSAGADDLVDARKRLDALRAIRKSKNFEPLTIPLSAFERFWRSPESNQMA